MGVIKNFSCGRTPPVFRSSQESLSSNGLSIPSTPSESEELPNDPSRVIFHPHRRDPALLMQRLEQISIRGTGARKARREDNARTLRTLAECDEETVYSSPTIEDFIPYSENPLTKIVTDFTAMRIWEYFLAKSEEEQRKYLEEVSIKRPGSGSANLGIPFKEAAADGSEANANKRNEGKHKTPNYSPDQRFRRVDWSLRTVLKRKSIPLRGLSYLEDDVIDVFLEDSAAIYISQELNSFQRLLLHGISQYHLLNSYSVDVGGSRRTKVKNKYSDFLKPNFTLTEYLEKRIRALAQLDYFAVRRSNKNLQAV